MALFAVILSVSTWLPWVTTTAHGGGHASAIGGSVGALDLPPRFGVGQLIVLLTSALLVAGAMTGRGLSARWAAAAALVLSALIVGLSLWYYRINVVAPVAAGYGFYIGVVAGVGALGCALWALVAGWSASRAGR